VAPTQLHYEITTNEKNEMIVECHPKQNLVLLAGLGILIYSFSEQGPAFKTMYESW